ncbi:MAG: hypothetical protein AUK47_04115 [Deltaproteobacteria bacterium CG2_30_63_29]|nr:MAG: hypothetical protein AUK47_04115 [Deltaproteobacteria bacterium CG2_30_63_29]PJB38508.1 MAG: hypothetical protein CO108_18895 [Deltaproteobacteria bacterium CG_4_9_14_3_um_filter_63_12]
MKWFIPAVFLVNLLTPSPVQAGEPDPSLDALVAKGGDALLEEADKRHNPFEDQTITVRMTLLGGGNDGNQYTFQTITKGDNLRAISFEEPADMKGMGVVIKGRDDIYVKLPDMRKVRRVGAHAKRQSFQSSDWNFDEMSMIRLGKDFSARILADETTGAYIFLECTRRDGVDLQYPKLKLRIDKAYILIDRIEYYDDGGEMVKLQERFEPKKLGGEHLIYTRVTMTDVAAKHTTQNEVLDEAVDQEVPDSTFSRRWLLRGI